MKKLMLLAAATVAACVNSAAVAGPFGLSQGTPLGNLKVFSKIGDLSYVIAPPQPNAAFSKYYVRATPVHGVCGVSGYSTPDLAKSDREFQEDFANIKALLDAKYGSAEPEKPPSLKAGEASIFGTKWRVTHRQLVWRGSLERLLPDDLRQVSLELHESPEGPLLKVSYAFSNERDCVLWTSSKDASGL